MLATNVEALGLSKPFTTVVIETVNGSDPHVPTLEIAAAELDTLIVGRPDVELKC